MDSIQQLNKIKAQLDNMGNLNGQLLAGNNGLSVLDIDLLKQQCISLYELIIKLNPASSESGSSEIISTKHVQPIIPEKEVVISEPIQVEEQPAEPKVELMPEPTLFTSEPIIEKKAEPEVLRSEISLHEKIANIKQPDVRTRLSDAKVDSLKAAINLNKKIAFVNELFKENTVEYAKAIDKLNSAIDLNEALRYFNELKHHYSWNNDHELVNDLEQLIQKRFR
jgi:hypothetical protein